MALFGGSRDVSLFHNLNKELINDIIQTEVAYYKFALEQTKVNVYGEAPGKQYFEPLKVACLIEELKDLLDKTTRLSQLERKNQEAQQTQETFYKVPYHIYIG